MWEFYRNNVFGGTAFSCYGGFWLSYGIFGILSSGGVLKGELPTHGTQMMLIIWGILTFIFFIQTLVINVGLMVLFSSLTVTFILLAVGENGHPRVTKAGGYFGIWTAAAAWYIATAELTNNVYRRKVIPLGVVNLATSEPSLTGVVRPDTL
jgi:succinate-acetate transporter protein